MRARLGVLSLASAALLFLGGAVRSRFGGTIALPLPATVQGLEPVRVRSFSEAMLQSLVFETLYAWNEGGTLGPVLALGDPVASANHRRFRVTLRPGVRFQDGRPVRAQEVGLSLAWTLRNAESRWLLADLEGAATHGPGSRGLPPGIVIV